MPREDILRLRPVATGDGGRGLEIVRQVSDELAVFRGSVTIVRAARRVGCSTD